METAPLVVAYVHHLFQASDVFAVWVDGAVVTNVGRDFVQGMVEWEALPQVDGMRLRPMLAWCACIAYSKCMQYTIRNISTMIDRALRERARREGKSLNKVAAEALARGLDLEDQRVRRRDLSAIAGSWVRDREVERALDEQRKVDPDLWR